jgi:hypothetical protein
MYQQPKTEELLRLPDGSLLARIQIRATLHILRIVIPHTAGGSAVYSTIAVVVSSACCACTGA